MHSKVSSKGFASEYRVHTTIEHHRPFLRLEFVVPLEHNVRTVIPRPELGLIPQHLAIFKFLPFSRSKDSIENDRSDGFPL